MSCLTKLPCTPISYLQKRESGVISTPQTSLLRSKFVTLQTLHKYDLKAHFGCVNAIEFSSHDGGQWIASGGDDKRVLLWNVQKALSGFGRPISLHDKTKAESEKIAANPVILKGEHHSNVFCLSFDNAGTKIFSGGNDEQVILHDIESGNTLDVFLHEKAVYSLSVDPSNDSVFASSTESGKVFIFDLRIPSTEDPFLLANYSDATHAVMYNPMDPRLLATANSKQGLALWDIRKPESCLLRYGGSMSQQSTMSVRFNRLGNSLIALRRRLPPVLYNISNTERICQFDHTGYYNSCTMKSCCFAGDQDQYIVSGSDDFNVYVWQIPNDLDTIGQWEGQARMVLKGHRSIVNQVRFNYSNHFIISSGVEKMIKVWSPFRLHNDNNLQNSQTDRKVYSHEDYINLVIQSGQLISHDYSDQSLDEDSRMLAFFDSLVQRELEGWSPDDSSSSASESERPSRFVQSSPSSSSSESDTDTIARPSIPFLQSSREADEEEESPFQILDLDRQIVEVAAEFSRQERRDDAREFGAPANLRLRRGHGSRNEDEHSVPVSTAIANTSEELHLPEASSAVVSEDEPSNHAGPSTRSLSITALINNRRADYFAGIKRFEERAQKKYKTKDSCKRSKVTKMSSKGKFQMKSSSSSSESGEEAKPIDLSVVKLNQDERVDPSDGEDSDSKTEQLVQDIVAARQRKMATLKSFKSLRARTLQEESDRTFGGAESSSACGHVDVNTQSVASCSLSVASSSGAGPSEHAGHSKYTCLDLSRPSTSHDHAQNIEENLAHSSDHHGNRDRTPSQTPPLIDSSEYHPSNGVTPDGQRSSTDEDAVARTVRFSRKRNHRKRRHYRNHDDNVK